ncbi:hypothetical protein [Halomonas organivorans]|uniref:TonB-dependent receptor n=1 Tax=Halomonas organivorans TaxID=257772 RepID=A0A7W5BZ54_9GAMM|nr:hypothetical protein [Halomonas organivorans]MBB3141750.1 hypothetical protein [Halomonas organivorans]
MKRSEHTKWLVIGIMVFSASLVSTAQAEETSGEGFGALEAMPTESMEQTRGRDGVNLHLERVNVQSVQDMDAITAGSSFQVLNGDMATGNITFERGSMGHYNGTGIFNSVTGNANAINNAIGISVYISNP